MQACNFESQLKSPDYLDASEPKWVNSDYISYGANSFKLGGLKFQKKKTKVFWKRIFGNAAFVFNILAFISFEKYFLKFVSNKELSLV